MKKNKLLTALTAVFFASCTLLLSVALSSCSVTRIITNQSEFFQRGDTAVIIQTKTTETYNAHKNQ